MPDVLDLASLLIPPPEQAPGFRGYGTEYMETFRKMLNDALSEIVNNQNEIITIIGEGDDITIGAGGGVPWTAVALSDYGSGGVGDTPNASTTLVSGAVCVIVTADSQIIVGTWHNAGGGANNYVIQLMKAAYPYSQWTNLAGDSKTPTTITWTGVSISNGNPSIVQCSAGNIHVGYFDSDAGVLAPKEAEYEITDDTWALDATNLLATSFAFLGNNMGEIVEAADGNLLWARKEVRGVVESIQIFRRLNGSWGTDPIATYTTYYDPDAASCLSIGTANGEDTRIVVIDETRVVAFWPWLGNTADSRYTLLYIMSLDGGATWPVGLCSGTNYAIGYPDTASGSIFPFVGGAAGPTPEANLRSNAAGGVGFGRGWDVALIPDTNRVAIVVWGDDAANVAHAQLPGVRYLEFDADGNGGLGSCTDVADWIPVSYQTPVVGLMLSVSDGVTRVLWGQGSGTTLNEGSIALMYSRVVDDGDPLDPADWTTPREVLRFAQDDSTSVVQYNQFTAPVSGVFEMENGEKVWPVLCSRGRLGNATIGSASAEAMLCLLRVADLDRV